MKALFFDNGKMEVRDNCPEPIEQEGYTRIQILKAGICSTDLALARGYMKFDGVPGHEFVGLALDGPFKGERVVGEINAACGDCKWCAGGMGRHCPNRSVLGILNRDGCFAEQISLPQSNLHKVADSLSDDQAVFVEPTAAAFEIASQITIQPGTKSLVVGDGKLGLLIAQVLQFLEMDVTLCGRHPERAKLISDKINFAHDLMQKEASADYELGVEATGKAEVLQMLLAWMKPRSTIVLKTTTEEKAELDLAPLVINELSLIGSRCGRFEPAINALERGYVKVDDMIEARYSFDDVLPAFEKAKESSVLKIIVDF